MKIFVGISFLLITTAFGGQAQSWANYYDSTQVYWYRDWNKCIDLLEKAIPMAAEQMGKDNNNYAVLLNDLGLSYWHVNDLEKATALLDESLQIKKTVLGEQGADYAASLLNAAGIYQEMGDVSKAENLYQKAINIYGKRHKNYAVALNNLGLLEESEGDYHKAEKLFLQAVEAEGSREIKNSANYAVSLNNLAGLYRKMGRYEDAEMYYRKALRVYGDAYGQNMAYGNVKGNLGALYQTMGRFAEAEKHMLEAVDIIAQYVSSDFSGYATLLNNLGSLYKSMGNYEASQRYYDESRQLYKEEVGEENPAYASALNNMAGLEMTSGNLNIAEELYLQAAGIYKGNYGEKHPLYSAILNNLASLYRKKSRFEKAEAYYLRSLEIDREILGKQHPTYAATLANLGLLYIAMGEHDKAEDKLEASIAIKSALLSKNHPSLANAINNLAILHYINKDLAKAGPLFLQAIESQLNQIETLFPAMSEKEKVAFYATLKSDLERFNTFAVLRSAQNPEILGEMYNNQLTTKGLIFRATDKMRDNILSSGDEQLIRDYNAWKDLKDELAQYYRLPLATLESRNIDLELFERQLNDLEKKLSQKSALFSEENNGKEITWKTVQSRLNEHEAAVEIIRFRDFKIQKNFGDKQNTPDLSPNLLYGWSEKVNYAALVIRKDKPLPELVLMENGLDMESKYFAYYKNSIKFNAADNFSYQIFWKPIQEKLGDARKVYISPDGIYFKINLNAIAHPGAAYIADEIVIRQVTSTKAVTGEEPEGNNKQSMVLVGDPEFHSTTPRIIQNLPGTRKEVELIASLSGEKDWAVNLFTGAEATEQRIKNLKSPKVLHIATHGYFSDNAMLSTNQYRDNPLFNTGLLLAGSGNTIQGTSNGEEDGLLTAYEAMNLKLDATDLVILSACETGLGEVTNGEGVYGLQRAFKVAGAKSIIFSLWKVDDEATRKLFTYFYEAWLENGNRWEAFKAARNKLREEYPSPYYWGAFVMVGGD